MKIIKRILVVLLMLVLLTVGISFAVVSYGTATRPVQHMDTINKYAKEYDVDPLLVLAVIKVESNFREQVVSHMNAHGYMQVLPETGKWIADRLKIPFKEEMLKDGESNIQLGTYYLSYLVHHFKDKDLAIAAYNGGIGNVKKWLLDEKVSKDGKTLSDIPIKETREYVQKVNKNYEIYSMFYGDVKPLTDDTNKSPTTWVRNYVKVIKSVIDKF